MQFPRFRVSTDTFSHFRKAALPTIGRYQKPFFRLALERWSGRVFQAGPLGHEQISKTLGKRHFSSKALQDPMQPLQISAHLTPICRPSSRRGCTCPSRFENRVAPLRNHLNNHSGDDEQGAGPLIADRSRASHCIAPLNIASQEAWQRL